MGRLARGLRREVTRRYAPEMQIMAQLGPLLLVRPIHEEPTSNDRVPTLRGKSVRGLGRVKTLWQKTDRGFPRSKALHHHRRARIAYRRWNEASIVSEARIRRVT